MINSLFSYKLFFKLFKIIVCCFIFNTLHAAEMPQPTRQVERPKFYYGVKIEQLEKSKPSTIKKLIEVVIKYAQAADTDNFSEAQFYLDDQLYSELATLREILNNRAKLTLDPLADARLTRTLHGLLSQVDPQNHLKKKLLDILDFLIRGKHKTINHDHTRVLLDSLLSASKELSALIDPEGRLQEELSSALERLTTAQESITREAQPPHDFLGIVSRILTLTELRRTTLPSSRAQPAQPASNNNQREIVQPTVGSNQPQPAQAAVSSNKSKKKGRAKKSPIPSPLPTPRALSVFNSNTTHTTTYQQANCRLSARPTASISKLLVAYHNFASN